VWALSLDATAYDRRAMPRLAPDMVRDRIPPRLRDEIYARWGTKRWIRRWIRDIHLGAIVQFEGVSGLEDQKRLEEFLPRLGIADDLPELIPTRLHWALGKGLRVWQYPCQFAPYLIHVARQPVRSYLEIGVHHGGSFIATVEYLRNQGHLVERAVAADKHPSGVVARYARTHAFAEQVTLDSASAEFRAFARRQTWDLVLIDGDHSFKGCLSDFETVHEYAQTIAFHDIVDSLATDVRRVWELVRREHAETYDFAEFAVQYPEVTGERTYLGIGVASRR
jgi:cephalosporin hydroxylase